MRPFSTQETLSTPLVQKWVADQDIDTLAEWLATGTPHPRLATEAIAAAARHGRPAIAEMVWNAGWHKPTLVFESAWRELRMAYHSIAKTGENFEARYADTLDWIIDKSTGSAEKKTAAHQNLSRVYGLELAFDLPTPQLWDRLLSLNTDCGIAAGNDLLQKIKNYVAWWPNPFAHEPVRVAQWAQDRVVPDLLSHGLKPGGSVWVGAMEKDVAGPLFDALLENAERITTPRQRLAIVLYAQHQGVLQERWDRMFDRFAGLGMPLEVRLTPSESNRAGEPAQRLAIAAADAQHDARAWTKHYNRSPLFDQDTVVAALKEPFQSRLEAQHRQQALDGKLPTAKPRNAPRF